MPPDIRFQETSTVDGNSLRLWTWVKSDGSVQCVGHSLHLNPQNVVLDQDTIDAIKANTSLDVTKLMTTITQTLTTSLANQQIKSAAPVTEVPSGG